MSETVYKKVDPSLRSLIDDIRMGEIALPDLQRPFVWSNAKIRNLFDSMYRGFPVGYLLFWAPAQINKSRAIGTDGKQRTPRLLVVDGQQRLTSLYAVVTGTPVLREGYDTETIEIAFNPLSERFEVADAAIRRDPAYIANITSLWAANVDIFDVAEKYTKGLGASREVLPEEARKIRASINKLSQLLSYPFTALELSSAVDEEQVSEVFVRINSEGKKLNQADFILTLMSVFWDEGRAQLEAFCRDAKQPSKSGPSSFNHFIEPGPDQLLRVAVGLAFRRARLKHVYSILRGKDLETEQFSDERREQQFGILKEAQARTINLQYWHDFLIAVRDAGFRSAKMISSQNNLLFAYILYLLGRTEFKMEEFGLRKLIARWFFMSSLTARYSSSPETAMEFDLGKLREVKTADEFSETLTAICASTVTNDYWSITLPTELATSAARSPSMFAYFAALNLLKAKVLYSKQDVSDALDPSIKAPRAALERHHLFPKGHLDRIGIKSTRDKNQIANFALVEWGDNGDISDDAPATYVPKIEGRFTKGELERMYYWHALPDAWTELPYQDFLRKRRENIATVVRDAYRMLTDNDDASVSAAPIDLKDLVKAGESSTTEFKATLRTNLHTNQKDPQMELSALKTIAGFLNSRGGGTLIVGVMDDGTPVGVEADKFPSEDKMSLHLMNLVKDRIGAEFGLYIHPRFDDFEQVRVFAIDCLPARSPVFVRAESEQRFYVRNGPTTVQLSGAQAQEYIKQRFN
ncbi:MAG: DUF262 domain-containing protein [Rhodospirillaceae bacterium]